MVPLSWYLALSAVLFTIGVVGVLIQRNIISLFMCIELMLNAVNLSLITFSRLHNNAAGAGQLFVFIVMAVAAAEAAVGLAIIIALFRSRETLNVDEADLLKL
jgi:NADH-quinone oxidoreductase subunit K